MATISLALSGLVLGSAFSIQAASDPGAVGPLAPGDLYLPLVMRNAGGPSLGGCAIFPADNWWNADISGYPVDTAHSDTWVNDIKLVKGQSEPLEQNDKLKLGKLILTFLEQ